MRSTRAGFAQIFLLVALAIFGVFASVSVRKFQLPESRALEDAAGPPWPRIPPGLRRPGAIHAGDVLTVRVAGEDDLSGVHYVNDSGLIDIPMAGPVGVAGVDVGEAARRVTKALADGFLMQPEVAVTILTSSYRTVFVVGFVQRGGVISTDEALTLDRVMTLAGGQAPGAGRTAFVVRPDVPRAVVPTPIEDTKARAFTFDVDREGGEVLQDGDTVYLRAAGMIAVMGHVQQPGLYIFEPGLTVAQAIVLAGGLAARASDRGVKISRFVNGTRRTIDADLEAALTPGDVVTIPGHRLFF